MCASIGDTAVHDSEPLRTHDARIMYMRIHREYQSVWMYCCMHVLHAQHRVNTSYLVRLYDIRVIRRCQKNVPGTCARKHHERLYQYQSVRTHVLQHVCAATSMIQQYMFVQHRTDIYIDYFEVYSYERKCRNSGIMQALVCGGNVMPYGGMFCRTFRARNIMYV